MKYIGKIFFWICANAFLVNVLNIVKPIEQTRIYTSIFIQLKCSIIKNIFGETDQRYKMAVYFQPQYEGAVLVCNEKKLKNTLLPDTCTQT